MKRTLVISGKEVEFKTSGGFPKFYRMFLHREIFADLKALEKESWLEDGGMEVLEYVAYGMAKFANPKMDMSLDDWLDQFAMFGLTEALPDITDMWLEEMDSKSDAKKKTEQQ